MSILNKIKNLFYDEEIIEEKIERPKSIEITKEELVKKEETDEGISERQFTRSEQNFKFPIIFEDEDIKEEPKREKIVEEKKEEKAKPSYVKPTLDRQVIKEVIERPKPKAAKFSVSPVISPVYGILDKNYQKDEVTNKNDDMYKTKELVINFDTIRQKAYGSLEDELTDLIENNATNDEEEVKEIELEKTIVKSDDLLDNLKEPEKEEYDFRDFGVEYKIDDSTKEIESPKHVQKEEKEIVLEKNDEEQKENEEKKEVELTDDLFSLIDSMYDN